MITNLAKMATGFAMMTGVGLPLRASAFAAMTWIAWWFALPVIEWAFKEDCPFIIFAPIVIAMSVGMMGGPWGLADFLRRVPFVTWCLITDDGKHVPIWAILVWPAVAIVDFALTLMTFVTVPCWVLWWIAKLAWPAPRWLWRSVERVGQAAWRVLNYTPFDRTVNPTEEDASALSTAPVCGFQLAGIDCDELTA